MKVSILSPVSDRILPIFSDDEIVGLTHADWIVSYNYRHILKEPLISKFRGRILNIHISLLPCNRGADPNFWSWFDDTQKGVTVHLIDEGIDTGNIMAQESVWMSPTETLRTSYEILHSRAVDLFSRSWPQIKTDRIIPRPQSYGSRARKCAEKEQHFSTLPLGYDTQCSVIEEMGRKHREKPKPHNWWLDGLSAA